MRPNAILLNATSFLRCISLSRASLRTIAGMSLWLAGSLTAMGQTPASLRRVVVFPGNGKVELEIAASRQVTPQTQVVSGPDRLVIDFPNTLPGPELRSQAINRGKVKGVRVGLFTAHPPVTRVVVDLETPQPYQIRPSGNSILVDLNLAGGTSGDSPLARLSASAPAPPAPRPVVTRRATQTVPATTFSVIRVPLSAASSTTVPYQPPRAGAMPSRNSDRPDPTPIISAVPYPRPGAASPNAVASISPAQLAAPAAAAPSPAAPRMNVDFHDGKLKIVAAHATLAAVLNEVHRRTGTQITLPAGGGMEEVFVSLGPAAPREVLAALLDGSHFNFIMVGSDDNPSQVRSVLLTPRGAGPVDGPASPAPYSPPLAAAAPEYTPPNVPEVANNPPPPPDNPPTTDDSTNAGVAPDSGEPDTGAQQPDMVVPRRPRSHRPVQDPPEQSQDPQQ